MSERRYTYQQTFKFNDAESLKGEWQILDMGTKGYSLHDDPVVFSCPSDDNDEFEMPATFKAKYEELCGRPEFIPFDEDRACGRTDQLVVMVAAGEDDEDERPVFNQPCKFGCLVPGHSVYCHNEGWLYGPRKCRRTWYTGGETRDEDCPGYKPNPFFKSVQK